MGINGKWIITLWINGEHVGVFSGIKSLSEYYRDELNEPFPSPQRLNQLGSTNARKSSSGTMEFPYQGKMYKLKFSQIKPIEKKRKPRTIKKWEVGLWVDGAEIGIYDSLVSLYNDPGNDIKLIFPYAVLKSKTAIARKGKAGEVTLNEGGKEYKFLFAEVGPGNP